MRMKNVMVVVAHPDDEVLGCGGLIQLLVKEGCKVTILYANPGYEMRQGSDVREVKVQIDQVNKYLRTHAYVLGNFKAGEMDNYLTRELVDFIGPHIRDGEIDTVITHCANDLHQDHLMVNKAVMICCRFKYQSKVKNVLTFPTISSSDISPVTHFSMNYFVKLSKQELIRKIKAMDFYRHELLAMPKNRGSKPITVWAEFLGLQSGVKYAEGFNIIRAINY